MHTFYSYATGAPTLKRTYRQRRRVLCAGGDCYNPPAVAAWNLSNLATEPQIVDLRKQTELSITRAVPQLEPVASPDPGPY